MGAVIVYDSETGNTERVAEGLRVSLGKSAADVRTLPLTDPGAVSAIAGSDTVLFGFWTDKGTCSPNAAAALSQLAGKRVFLFGTAGFGESPEYFEHILGSVRAKLPGSASYAGGAMCQGQMGEAVKARFEAQAAADPDDPRCQMMLRTYAAALGHPDADDIEAVASAARESLGL